ncbi:zinc-binding dehydrogenase [Amycolatopsis jejuensis]|uniref:zinc-binding dehydrogenase n=1 Tax=Amycolatopsis jejuensis TaxID=330084 RepID=UPI0005245FA9|nr:alcohol dehydrogenase catalytic domain-containing protein [Amycolatopsis jejuensis]
MQTIAAVAPGPREPLRIERIDVAAPGPGEVLVEIKASGLCHTDLVALEGLATANVGFPGIPGHEGAGVVVEIGAGVTTLRPGDRVVAFLAECGTCPSCLSGKTNLCQEVLVDLEQASRSTMDGTKLLPFQGLGTFTNHAVLREICLAKIDADVPFAQLCCLGCAVSTGLGAALNTAKVTPGSSVVVFGMGGVGLSIVQGARIAGAGSIIAVDVNADKESIAAKLGATRFVDASATPSGELVPLLRELTGGGADFTFEAVGRASIMRQAFDATRHGWGVCTIVGLAPSTEVLEIPPYALLEGRTIKGSPAGDVKGRSHIPEFARWVAEGKVDIGSLITDVLTLDQINDGFRAMHDGTGIRSVVVFDERAGGAA